MRLEPDTALVSRLYPSPNFTERRSGLAPKLLILHYTGLATVERSLEVLADPRCQVSCHYVIDEAGRITQMVAEGMRAWHAGVSFWAGERDINSASIGIEIHNPGHSHGYPDFPPDQMDAVRELCLDICTRNAIAPEGVLAHSDIAPRRKADPGEKFDWARLAEAGVGHWAAPAAIGDGSQALEIGARGAQVEAAQRLLATYGYEIDANGELDEHTRYVLAAFQRHFRPALVDGRLDASTTATLERLVASIVPRPRPDANVA